MSRPTHEQVSTQLESLDGRQIDLCKAQLHGIAVLQVSVIPAGSSGSIRPSLQRAIPAIEIVERFSPKPVD